MKAATIALLVASPVPAMAVNFDPSGILAGGAGLVFAAVGTLFMRQLSEFERRMAKLEEATPQLGERIARLEGVHEGR